MKFPNDSKLLNLLAKHSNGKKCDRSLLLHSKWRYFGCISVRSAVLVIGLWHIAIHLLGFALFISAFYLMPNYCSSSFYGAVSTPSSIDHKIFAPNFDSLASENLKLSPPGVNLSSWLSLFSFCCTLSLFRGVLKKKSSLILPFFIIQILDILFDAFVIASLIMLSSNIDEFFTLLSSSPLHRFLTRFTSYHKKLFAMIYVLVSFTMKTCLMRIVYLYYQFLRCLEET